jgi:hypothetical protein
LVDEHHRRIALRSIWLLFIPPRLAAFGRPLTFLKFLCSSRWRELGDPAVANAVRFMRIFLVIYLLLLVGIATVVLSVGIK